MSKTAKLLVVIFSTFLIILLPICIHQIFKRIFLEEKNKAVEIVLDFDDLKRLSIITKTEMPKLLNIFRRCGVRTLAVRLKEVSSNDFYQIIKINENDKDFDNIPFGSTVIFDNNIIFDSKIVIQKNLKVALIEFYKPVGFEKIPIENLITLHTFKENEIFKYSKEKIVKRFLRACMERKIKILYVRLNFGFKKTLEENVELVEDLKTTLFKSKFYLEHLDKNPYVIGSDKYIWLKKIISFLISVLFPICGFIISLNIKKIQLKFLVILIFSLCGIILISALLSSSSFLIKLEQFSGTKLSLLIPVIFIFFYLLFKHKYILKEKFHLSLVLGLLILLFIIIILRSGNYNFPLFPFEEDIREFFEEVFIARPRTKEFLIGHPFLIFGLYFYTEAKNNIEKLLSILFISIGFIGQTSMINTFCHIHINFIISSLRTIYGLIFGILIGYVLIICQKLLRKY